MEREYFEAVKRKSAATGNLIYLLEVFGHELASRHGYRNLDGMDAVYLYLINKHHWLPRDVRSMSTDDLLLTLHEEMQGWTAPPSAR